MIAKYNRRSLYWGAPGLVLQIAGPMMFMMWENEATGYVGAFAALIGFTMLMIGFGFYVKAKEQHPAWALLALLSWLGFIVLARLPDRHQQSIDRINKGLCPNCEYDLRGDYSSPCSECGWRREAEESA